MFGSNLNEKFLEKLQLTPSSNNTTLIIVIFVILISITVIVVVVIVIIIVTYTSYTRKKENISHLTEFVAELELRDKSERFFKSGKSHKTYFILVCLEYLK